MSCCVVFHPRVKVEMWVAQCGAVQEGRKEHLGESEKVPEVFDPIQGDRWVKRQVHARKGVGKMQTERGTICASS